MKSQKKILVAVIAVVGALVIFLIRGCHSKRQVIQSTSDSLRAKESKQTLTDHYANERRNRWKALLDSYKHSITLYGKVVDQFGEPVPDATVEIYVYSGYFENKSGTDAVLKTDQNGKFSVSGFTGGSIAASTMKDGYLRIPPMNSIASEAILSYTGGNGTGDQHSIPSNPIVLHLHKIGSAEPMVHVPEKLWKLPVDGTPQIIALDSKEGKGAHQIEFRFMSNWGELPKDNEINSKQFDWSLELRVPGGGFIWDESDLKFEAPASGYREVVRYEYPRTMPREEWKRFQKGRYFVKFTDNTFGRIQFDIDGASNKRPLTMESWLNLTLGSRNMATKDMIINVIESVEPSH